MGRWNGEQLVAGNFFVARPPQERRRFGWLLTAAGGTATGAAAAVGFFMMAPYPSRWVVGAPAYLLLPVMVAIGSLALFAGLHYTGRLWGAAGFLSMTGAAAMAGGAVFKETYMFTTMGLDDGVAYQPNWLFAVGALLVIASLPLAMIAPKPREP